MTEFFLHPPVAQGNRLCLDWQVDPPSSLYKQTHCEMVFPDDVDVGALPPGLIASAVMLILHAHWPLLQPCRVRLPFRLPAGERLFWERMMEAQFHTMAAYHPNSPPALHVELIEDGPALPPPSIIVTGQRRASAFSGGKDSLFQAGVLGELGGEPLLVATTSPTAPTANHLHPKRRRVFEEITSRRNVRLVEVNTDYRSCYDNLYSRRAGYKAAINELSDTLLYLASLVLTSAALNTPHLYMASENEVQDNIERDGRIIQHPHATMYAQTTLEALGALLAPWGFTLGSMTSGLLSGQVQQTLWRRWPDLRGMQFSCWATPMDADMCNRCSQCLRVALCALDAGGDPVEMGADLILSLNAMRDWRPRSREAEDPGALPGTRVSGRLHQQVLRYVRRIGVPRMARYLWRLRGNRYSVRDWAGAMRTFVRLYFLAGRYPAPSMDVYRPGYLDHLDADLREPLRRLIESAYRPAPESTYRDALARTRQLAGWISAPLAGHAGAEASGIETIRHGTDVLAIIVRASHRPASGITFLSPPDFVQQFAVMRRPKGEVIQAHTHPAFPRPIENFQETLWVRSGRVRMDLFAPDGSAAVSLDLAAGDAVLLAGGGHGFTFIEETELIEIKQGPYNPSKDKTILASEVP